jgi:hypothetical protein
VSGSRLPRGSERRVEEIREGRKTMPRSWVMWLGVLGLLLTAGCEDKKAEILQTTKESLQDSIEQISRHPEEQPIDRDYVTARLWAAYDLVKLRPPLDTPSVILAELVGQVDGATDSEYYGWVEWLDYETQVVGLVLIEQAEDGPILHRVPVFAYEKPRFRGRSPHRETAWESRHVRVMLTHDMEPAVRPEPRKDKDDPPLVLHMPLRLMKDGLEVGVYDNKGNVSHEFVPLFIFPEAKAAIDRWREAHRASVAPSP